MDETYKPDAFMGFFKLIYALIIFLIILGASYYFSRFIGRKATRKNKLMKHIEALSFGNDKSVHIVKICDEFYLISCSQKDICLLDKLSKDTFKDDIYDIESKLEDVNFQDYLDNTYDNENLEGNKYSIKHNIEKLKKIVKGNRTNE